MRVQVTERHCEVPASVLARAESQMQRLEKYESKASSAEVVFEDEKHSRKVELIIRVDGTPPLIANGEGSDFRSALDEAIDRMSRSLREQHQRRRDHKAPPLSEGVSAE